MSTKFGFVYIWFDRKHKRYYVGSHWGTDYDTYICSSTWMRKSYKRRPNDFKRKILVKIFTNRNDLYLEEQKWLNCIKDQELGNRYYNLTKMVKPTWHADPEKVKIIGAKISAANKGRAPVHKDPVLWAKSVSEGKKRAFKKRFEETGSNISEDHRNNLSLSHTGKSQSSEQVEKKSRALKIAWKEGRHKGMTGKIRSNYINK